MRIICSLTLLTFAFLSSAQNYQLPLWSDGVPNSKSTTSKIRIDSGAFVSISHVQTPMIDVYLPTKRNATGQAIVICPGGGYGFLAYDWEGTDIAKFLNAKGIAGIVLKYRLPDDDSNIEPDKSPLMDAKQAMKLVRSNAESWNIDPSKVGVMGFSAGGHLASTLGTHFEEDSRPDFMVLIYPVISFQQDITHMGSRNNLIGRDASQEMVDYYSNEKQIKENTPPTFLIHSSDDRLVPVANSIAFYQALVAKDIPAEMHIYPIGGHGFGLGNENEYLTSWQDLMITWMNGLEN